MSRIQKLSDIYARTLQWEKGLSDLYDVAEVGLERPESIDLVRRLHRDHDEKRRILESVDPDAFGPSEWVAFGPGTGHEEMVPNHQMARDRGPQRVLEIVLRFEQRLEEFYAELRDVVVSHGHRELFESLATFKHNQAERIRRLMREYPPAE